MQDLDRTIDKSSNPDPMTGAPGAHPVGTGVGALLGGAAAGAVAGTVVGPVGTVIGAALGAIAGGLAGKGVAEVIDPTLESDHWRDAYRGRPYVATGSSFDDYGPAYGYGVSAYERYPNRSFDDAESELASGWSGSRGASTLSWDHAKHAARDAWQRVSDTVERVTPGDSDRDGK